MNRELFFESAGDERGTPISFFDTLNAEFAFTLDAAASSLNHKCDLWFGEGGIADNALEQDWGGEGSSVFINPPYSVAGAFVAKAREEADKGAVVVQLLPVRTDTKWWQGHVWDASRHDFRPGVECRFIPGRLSFELQVPTAMRVLIKQEFATLSNHTTAADLKSLANETVKRLVEETGLPAMAIQGIREDKPDEDLLSSAPFPSAVVIFRSAQQ